MPEQECVDCGSTGADARLKICPNCGKWVCPYCAEDIHDCEVDDDEELVTS